MVQRHNTGRVPGAVIDGTSAIHFGESSAVAHARLSLPLVRFDYRCKPSNGVAFRPVSFWPAERPQENISGIDSYDFGTEVRPDAPWRRSLCVASVCGNLCVASVGLWQTLFASFKRAG